MARMVQKSFQGLSPRGFHNIAYTEWGQGPRTIICVHGLTRNSRDFDALAEDLADRLQARVICPDIVGRGQSDRLVDPDHYGYPQYLNDMATLIARTGCDSVEWVGTSMGGLIGMLLASQPGTPIRRLVINDIGPFVPKAALERIATYVGEDKSFPDAAALERFMRQTYAGFGDLTDAQWAHMARHTTRPLHDGRLGLAYDPGIARIFARAPITDVDMWPVWNAIACPTLVIRGGVSDLLLAETASMMAVTGPKAEIFTVPGVGHAPALMDADQIAAIRGFLARAA